MVTSVDFLFVLEFFHGRRFLSIRQPHQNVRETETDVLRVVTLAEIFPCDVSIIVENLCNVPGTSEFREVLPVEQGRASRCQERCMRYRGDVRHIRKQLNVFRMSRNLVISHKTSEWLTTQSAVSFLVDFLEDRRCFPIVLLREVLQNVFL